VVRKNSLSRLPDWLKLNKSPAVEPNWPSLVQTLTGHSDFISAMALPLDGQRIVSAGDAIKMWNASTGQTMKTIPLVDTKKLINSLACSGNGQLIVYSSSSDVKLLNAGTGSDERTLVGHWEKVLAVAISHDDQWIASGSRDNSVRLWDANKGLVEKTLVGHSDEVWAVAFSPDSRRIASGSKDKTIKLWETLTGGLKTFIGHKAAVAAVVFSPDGRLIVSGSWDQTIRVWETTTALVEMILVGHTAVVLSVAFSSTGHLIGSGSWDETVKLWDTMTGELQNTLVGHSGKVNNVAFFPTGQRVVSSSNDKTIKIWDTSVKGLQRDVPVNYRNKHGSIAFSPNGFQIAYGSNEDSTVIVWDIQKGCVGRTLVGHTANVTAVAFSSDGRQVASASYPEVKIWNVDTGENKATLDIQRYPDNQKDVAFLPGGRSIVSLSNYNRVRVSDVLTRNVKDLSGNFDLFDLMALSRNGRWLASRSSYGEWSIIKVYNIEQSLETSKLLEDTESERLELLVHQEIETSAPVSWFNFSPDGAYLATNCGIYRIRGTTTERSSHELDASQFLYVHDQWIKCGQTPVLRIPPDFSVAGYDVNGDQIAIRFYSGGILILTIDRRAFLSATST